jgi:Tfp pilus assembly protein PilP
MKLKKTEMQSSSGKNMMLKFFVIFYSALIVVFFSFYGCSDKPSSPPAIIAQTQSAAATVSNPVIPQPESVVEETSIQKGYIYQQRDRRDPFVPLIKPKKKLQERDGSKVGTLEGYDISEFTLAAVARKGREYFALITTPDNRSFTIIKGTVVGLNKGKVKEITGDKVILVESIEDRRGNLEPREIILEFHKGEVE